MLLMLSSGVKGLGELLWIRVFVTGSTLDLQHFLKICIPMNKVFETATTTQNSQNSRIGASAISEDAMACSLCVHCLLLTILAKPSNKGAI